MNMVSQAQAMSGQTGSTEKLGGMELAPMISEQILRIAALSTGMSNQAVRFQGGTTGMLGNRIQGALESAGQPIASQLAALHTYFQGDAATQNRIVNYSKSGHLTDLEYRNFLQSLPGNPNELLGYANNNVTAAQIGFSNAPELMKAGGASKVANLMQKLYYQWGGARGQGGYAVQRAQELLKSGNIQGFLTDRMTNVGEFSGLWKDVSDKGYLDDYMIAYNPTMASNYSIQKRVTKEGVRLEKEIAKSMGSMNSPVLQRLAQAIASGDVGRDGISALLKPLGVVGSEYADILGNTDAARKINQSENVYDAAINAGSKTTGISAMGLLDTGAAKDIQKFSDLAAKYGINPDQLEDLAATGGDMKKMAPLLAKGGLNQTDALSIYRLADHSAGVKSLKGTSGYDLDSIKKFFTGKIADDVIDKQVTKINKDLNKGLFDVINAGGSFANGASLSGLGKIGGADDIYKTFENMQGETGYEASGGGYKLSGAHADIAKAMGIQNRIFSNQDAAEKASQYVDDMVAKSPIHDYIAKHMEVKGLADKAKEDNKKASEPDILNKILKELGQLSGMTAAIQSVANAISPK
jgi:hypothetical protein